MRVLNRKETVTFKNEFRLRNLGQTFPAGQYTIETIDEILEGMSFLVFRRRHTIIHLPKADTVKKLQIDPNDLGKALEADLNRCIRKAKRTLF
jgi:hypothetical protein